MGNSGRPARDGETRDNVRICVHCNHRETVHDGEGCRVRSCGCWAFEAASARDGETLSDEQVAEYRRLADEGYALRAKHVLALCDTVAALRAELADARADKARLDWLESTRQEHFGFGDVTPIRSFGVVGPIDSTLRDAIDAARAASGEDASHE